MAEGKSYPDYDYSKVMITLEYGGETVKFEGLDFEHLNGQKPSTAWEEILDNFLGNYQLAAYDAKGQEIIREDI